MNAPITLYFLGRGDAYLEWAQHTNYAHFSEIREIQPAASSIGLLVKWKNGQPPSKKMLHKLAINLPITYAAQAICALSLLPKQITQLLSGKNPFLDVEFSELATPVVTEQAQITEQDDKSLEWLHTPALLLGVIDHGCPFANASFRMGNTSRIVALWDQNPRTIGLTYPLSKTTLVTTDYGYGAHWARYTLNRLLKTTGSDEEMAYALLNMPFMRQRVLHGAHVLDVLAGPVPVSSRVSSTRNTIKGGAADGSQSIAPTWASDTYCASTAPIVFVQLPQAAVDDSSGRWLGRYVLDGLHYFADCAARLKVKRAVINISWGPQTGPHDGSSLLEQAMDTLVSTQSRHREFAIVLPAGNSYEARSHAQFDVTSELKSLTWHVPPGSRSPAFLEVWWPKGVEVSQIQMTVTAPNGDTLSNCNQGAGIASQSDKSWGITLVPHGNRCMALLALAPTFSQVGSVTAPHGVWNITITPSQSESAVQGDVHIFVARTNPNIGSKVKSQASYLHDELYDPQRYLRAAETDKGKSAVMRAGTLSGIATGKHVWTVSGYVMATQKPAKYASAGSDSGIGRQPDWALPTDESEYLPGILAGGVRSGSVFRLVGTSTASPQLARFIANNGVSKVQITVGQTIDARVGAGRRPQFIDV